MAFTTLITVEELVPLWEAGSAVILDARFDIDDEDRAREIFAQEHIPGARQADVSRHMAGEIVPGLTGRRPLPHKEDFAHTIRCWGIDESSQVVIYDDMNGIMAASRLWTMLRWAGLKAVAVLDGGYQAWVESGLPITAAVEPIKPSTYQPTYHEKVYIHLPEILDSQANPRLTYFDSRSLEDGVPSHDAIKGHIPGSRAADRAKNSIAGGGRWRTRDQLREHYSALIGDRHPSEVIFYCGSGITAAQNVLGMAHAGFEGSRMYVGSWSEWILDPSRPIDDSWEIGESGPPQP